MLRLRSWSLIVLFLTLALAGCARAPEPEPEPVDARPLLADFSGCPWSYPDNTSVDCDASVPRLEPQETVPPATVCVERHEPQGWSFHWDPVADTRGIWYEAPDEVAGTEATLRVRSGGTEHLFVWEDAPASGYLELPIEFGENVSFRFDFHDLGYATNGTLDGAQGTPVWSLYERQWWVVHRFAAADGMYAFQNMTTQQVRVDSEESEEVTFRTFHYIEPFALEGQDFTLLVHYVLAHTASSQGLVETVGVDRFCQLGLGG